MLRLAVGAHIKAEPVANVCLVYPLLFASQTLDPLRREILSEIALDLEEV
jgi:hypothetical protein